MAWWPIAAMAASAVLSYANQKQVAKKQDSYQKQKLVENMKRAGENEAATTQFLNQNMTPEARNQAIAESEAAAAQRGAQDAGAVTAYVKPTDFAGRKTDDFTASAEAGTTDNQKRLADMLRQLSIQTGVGERGYQTGKRYNTTVSQVGGNNDAIRNLSYLYDNAAQSVRPNPWMSLASQVAGAAGSYGMGSMLAPGAGAVGPATTVAPYNPGIGLQMNPGAISPNLNYAFRLP